MAVIQTILPVIVIALTGYIFQWKKIISSSEGLTLEKVSFNIFIPSLLFYGTATADFPDRIEWSLLAGFYIPVFIIYLSAMLIGKIFFSYKPAQLSVFGMGASYSNITIVGIPLCLQLFGGEAFLPLFIIISIHNILLFGFGIIVAESKRDSTSTIIRHIFQIFKSFLKNPLTCSLVAGISINILNISIYPPLLNAVNLMSQAAIPMSLFSLGGALTRYKISGELSAPIVLLLLKLIALPSLVWFFVFHLFEINEIWAGTAVILASTPVGISPYIFSRRYQACESQIASAVVLTSALSVVTASLFILLIYR
jgi:malonate transporter